MSLPFPIQLRKYDKEMRRLFDPSISLPKPNCQFPRDFKWRLVMPEEIIKKGDLFDFRQKIIIAVDTFSYCGSSVGSSPIKGFPSQPPEYCLVIRPI